MPKNISKRILYYSHNSFGVGHTIRTLSICTAIKKKYPAVDLIVVTGSSLPQIFLQNNIETVKIPSMKSFIHEKFWEIIPKYLSLTNKEVFKLRYEITNTLLKRFKPDIFIIEHSPFGLIGELKPILKQKLKRKIDSKIVLVTRGIAASSALFNQTKNTYLLDAFDYFFVADDKKIGINNSLLPVLKNRLKFIGRTCIKSHEELPEKTFFRKQIGYKESDFLAVISIGRGHNNDQILKKIIQGIRQFRKNAKILIFSDPYQEFDSGIEQKNCRILPFTANLVDYIYAADVVFCKAGYNTISELLLTGSKAIIIPRSDPSKEQVDRVKIFKNYLNAIILDEDRIDTKNIFDALINLNKIKKKVKNTKISKYAVANKILKTSLPDAHFVE